MKHLDEYREIGLVRKLAAQIRNRVTRPWTIMEICGGQTHSIMRYRLDTFLPEEISLVHGPGCPVCVTPTERIDQAIQLALKEGVILASFGDMLRVPGSETDLLAARAAGGDVRMVYSPLDALRLASENPDREVVFFAVGFETTAPANALSLREARRKGIANFSLLSAQVLVPPAIRTILGSEGNRINGFLAAGHVCAVTGYEEYIPIAEKYHTPIAVTGFEPVDILQGILMCIEMLEKAQPAVGNAYSRAVNREGNPAARKLMEEVFRVSDREWRGIGLIPDSGLEPAPAYKNEDALSRFSLQKTLKEKPNPCQAGRILKGEMKPSDCPAFGRECTPEHPLGAPMVSAEGACAAYYRYGDPRTKTS